MTSVLSTTSPHNAFTRKVQLELKRASRYRTFISVIIVDASAAVAMAADAESAMKRFSAAIRQNVRETDEMAMLEGYKIGLLTPETSRQGADIAARRVAELIKATAGETETAVPVEVASFPDAGGNRTMAEFIEELAVNNPN